SFIVGLPDACRKTRTGLGDSLCRWYQKTLAGHMNAQCNMHIAKRMTSWEELGFEKAACA
ncbi:hypothetical protein, partial [Fluviicoccus keumensis]|uniref:hypothetical protein n=1 Tax=Fluviicoccus keumensis TaxID=1435465 RepID=UPI001A91F490